MKPHLLQVAPSLNRSFSIRQESIPNINSRWHCHKELELVHLHRGSGTQFVGDSIRRFHAGDMVLVGANLPHYWHFDQMDHDQSEDKPCRLPYATVVHFTEDFWGSQFLSLPENAGLRGLFDKSRQGLSLTGTVRDQVATLLETLCQVEGTYRLITLLECLLTINEADEKSYLASMGFRYEASEAENERLSTIYAYTLSRFHEKISLHEVASLAGLVPNSFCRYFKSRTGKSYSQFLLEIRVGNACKLLIKDTLSIKQICYESGFNNFTCFYKKFRLITGKSPLMYQRTYFTKRS